MAYDFNHQYPDMTQAFGVPPYFLQNNIPQNAQFAGPDTRSQQTLANRAAALENNQHQIMMPDAALSQVINPRDLQINPFTEATGPPEPEPLAAEPAAAPTGHDEPESDEEEQGSPDEPVDAAGYFYIPGIGGIGGEEGDDGELDLGGFNLP